MLTKIRPSTGALLGMRWIGAVLLFAITASLGLAQLPTATILGVVRDATGAVVPSANLTARNTDTGQTRTTVSSADGSYRFSALPVGPYEVRVEHAGFQTGLRSGMTLAVSQEAVVNFTLQVGAVSQTVAVTAEAPLVDTTSGSLGGLVDEQKVSDLPLNGRNYIDLALLQLGVNIDMNRSSGEATWFSSNGAPVRSNYYMLDGTPTRNIYGTNPSSMSSTALGVEGIREFRIVTNAFSAEYGMSMGSQMVVVSKGGTNRFHGTAFEYLRNSAMDARNFFDYLPDRRLPEFIRNQFGGSFGGPIQKDKTFFYAVIESLHQRLGATTVTHTIPAGCRGVAGATITSATCSLLDPGTSATVTPQMAPLLALFPLPNLGTTQIAFPGGNPILENYGQIRMDHTFSDKDTIFARVTVDKAELLLPQSFPQFTDVQASQLYYVTLSESHVFTPSLLNTGRASWSGTRLFINGPLPYLGPQYSLVAGMSLGQVNIGGVDTFGPDAPIPFYGPQYVWTWSDDLFYTRGKHSLKFGALINRITQKPVGHAGIRGSVTFGDFASFLGAKPSTYNAITPGSILDRAYRNETYGFYAQDDLRVTPRLTLNLGLRYEFNTVPRELNNPPRELVLRDVQHDAALTPGPILTNPSLHNFSPRFGFAWDVLGNGKMAIRGGFALLYDVSNLGASLINESTAQPPLSSRSTVSNPGAVLPGGVLTGLPLPFPASAQGNTLSLDDYFLKQPSLRQYNLTLERQLPGQMNLTLAYAGSRGFHIIGSREGNPSVPQGIPLNGVCVARPTGQAVNLNQPTCWLTATDPRTNPHWGTISFRTAGGNSWYSSMQFGLVKRLTHGLQFQSSFTWSKSIDEIQNQIASDQTFTESAGASDPIHRTVDRAVSVFDSSRNWHFNMMYHLPNVKSSGFTGKFLNGWWMSAIESLQSGFPFTACLQRNRSQSQVGGGTACTDRPNLVAGRNNSNITSGTTEGCPGVTPGQKLGTPNRWFDPCAFTIPALGFLGTAGRNILRGPGFATLDYSLVKDTSIKRLGEGGQLEFRAEFFNILNRANFGFTGTPGRTVYAGSANAQPATGSAGVITSTVQGSSGRQIQLALKLIF